MPRTDANNGCRYNAGSGLHPVSGPATSPQQSKRFSQSYVFSLCRVLVINEGLLLLGKDPQQESMERTLDPSPGSPSAPNQMWCKEVHGEMCWLRYQPCHPLPALPSEEQLYNYCANVVCTHITHRVIGVAGCYYYYCALQALFPLDSYKKIQ